MAARERERVGAAPDEAIDVVMMVKRENALVDRRLDMIVKRA